MLPLTYGQQHMKFHSSMYSLSGIAHPAIRSDVCDRVERQKQSTRKTYSLFHQIPTIKRLKSKQSYSAIGSALDFNFERLLVQSPLLENVESENINVTIRTIN